MDDDDDQSINETKYEDDEIVRKLYCEKSKKFNLHCRTVLFCRRW